MQCLYNPIKKQNETLLLIQRLLKIKKKIIPEKLIVIHDLFEFTDKMCIHTFIETIMFLLILNNEFVLAGNSHLQKIILTIRIIVKVTLIIFRRN